MIDYFFKIDISLTHRHETTILPPLFSHRALELFYMNKTTLLALCAVLPFLSSGCLKKEENAAEQQHAPQPTPVTILIAKPETHIITTTLTGRLEPYKQAEVRARVPGIIKKRTYDEGQIVEEGTVLFEIEPDMLQASNDVAKASLERAKASLERAKVNLTSAKDRHTRYSNLVKSGAVSEREYTESMLEEMKAQAELASAQAELASAQAELNRTTLNLGYATVTSPIRGKARRALVTEGALVGMDTVTPLTTVEQIDPIYLKFSQPATEYYKIRNGLNNGSLKRPNAEKVKAHLSFNGGGEYEFPGEFIFSDMAVNESTDTIEMRVLFPNPKFELFPGMFASVTYELASQNVIKVPRDAVVRTVNGPVVMSVNEQNLITSIPVKADNLEGKFWLITEGLKGGEKIIAERAIMTKPGDPAEIVKTIVPGQEEEPASPDNTQDKQ